MLEDQVAFLLQKYLGNYVRGLNKEALKISVWRGDVELTNMQLKPEALNALKLPIKVKAGFLGSVRLKVPWSRLGQEPVQVILDRIFVLAEPATQVEGSSEVAIEEAKKNRVRELETKLLESQQQIKSEMNSSWLGSLIGTIIGNLKLAITNIHIRYEDVESNPDHPFASGLMLSKLSAVTIDNSGKETFASGGALDRIQKSAELERLAFYFDSDTNPWCVDKPWEKLSPSEWSQIFELQSKNGKSVEDLLKEHTYVLQPVTGNARYVKLRPEEAKTTGQALQKAAVNLDNVILCLPKNCYRDILKLADNFSAFNQRLKYAHYRPNDSVKSAPGAWWKYACKVVTEEVKKTSGKLSWEQVLRFARLRKKYVSLYASLLKADSSRLVVDDNEEIQRLDHQLDIEVILQWRMLAHKFVEQTGGSDLYASKRKAKKPWWSFGWGASSNEDNETRSLSKEDWEQLNTIIGYKEDSDDQPDGTEVKGDLLQISLEIYMKQNASRLISDSQQCLADLSCEGLNCSLKSYAETKVFDLKLGSYKLSTPYGLLAESATTVDSLVGKFSYKPFDSQVDWSFVAKASPCYVTYIRDSVDQIVAFFKSNTTISRTLALETAAAVQMTLDGVKRTAQQEVTRALKDYSRFFLDLDIAAPKVIIPTKFYPDNRRATRLLLDLGHLTFTTRDLWEYGSSEERDIYLQFNLVLSDVSAFLVDGEYQWKAALSNGAANHPLEMNLLPVLEKCGIAAKLQQISADNPFYPSTRLSVRLPSLGLHFSPARYHRLMQVAKLFENEEPGNGDVSHPWDQADFEGWLYLLSRKGVGNREAIWQRRYLCLVGPYLYILESPASKSYKQYLSLSGKQVQPVSNEFRGDIENVLAVYDAGQSNSKAVEDSSALILKTDNVESRRMWQTRLQGAIYRASGSAAITNLEETSDSTEHEARKSADDSINKNMINMETLFITGVLDELKIFVSYSHQRNNSFKKMLISKENPLFEFRAIGGQVEVSMKANNLLVGTVLNLLEIEDKFCCSGQSRPRYLARSFINNVEAANSDNSPSFVNIDKQDKIMNQQGQTDGEEKFFEALDDLNELNDPPSQRQGSVTEYFSAESSLLPRKPSMKPPTFSRIAGLIPDAQKQTTDPTFENLDDLESFVKAQMVIYSQDSPLYRNLDNRVVVTLATLSFYCHRPTILALLEFVNAINSGEENSDKDADAVDSYDTMPSDDYPDDQADSAVVEEPLIEALLGKGKSRVVFYLTLNLAKAEIFLMNEDGTSLASLSQNNLLTDIKVFPSSFSIKAALGNLKISDNSLPSSHPYFWICDMRDPEGSSFVELDFSSFSSSDEDYNGYDYSLIGQLSEIRVLFLNRFVQEVVSYFLGLVPSNKETFVKLKDRVSNSEIWVSTNDIEGSPALKLDLSLKKPIILMPKRTDSMDYLQLDVPHITVQNTFSWLGGDKNDMNAVHLEVMTIKVQGINLTVGNGKTTGESIIEEIDGLSIDIRRSLRDLLHLIPSTEVAVKVEVLKAAVSNKEYEIITECALSNISETPRVVPRLESEATSIAESPEPQLSDGSGTDESASLVKETWITMRVSVAISLVELSLHSGPYRDSPLARVQAAGAWLLYKSTSSGEGFLFATLKGFSVFDDRVGTKQELRLAIGRSGFIWDELQHHGSDNSRHKDVSDDRALSDPTVSMLTMDAKFNGPSTNISVCIQRPMMLVVLDFLLATIEFFVPSVRNMLSDDDDGDPLHVLGAVIIDQPIFLQPSQEFALSPQRPLIVDDERFDHFVYDGQGGKLYLQDRKGRNISSPLLEAIIYVGNGRRLQFKNVTVMNGEYLDSCISLGADSSYSASETDFVFLENENRSDKLEHQEEIKKHGGQNAGDGLTELVLELQAVGPELTFYSSLKDMGETYALSPKVMHANLDAFCRLIMKGDSLEMTGNVLGLKVESNGIRVLEPFDACVNFSNASGKTNIHLGVSDIYMNFTFSVVRLFLAVEEDIMTFLRMTSKKATVVCSQFDRVGNMQNYGRNHTYAFWRPRAPSGFAVLGDCLTPLNEAPSKGVLAVNTSLVKVKRPMSYKLIWSSDSQFGEEWEHGLAGKVSEFGKLEGEDSCSIWFPVAPEGYVAVGCVVSSGKEPPPLSCALCILASLVSPCSLKDCIAVELQSSRVAIWRVENSFGSFLPANASDMSVDSKAYDLRHMIFGNSELSKSYSKASDVQNISEVNNRVVESDRPAFVNSGRMFEAIARFKLIWWNQGTNSQKKLSIWRPVVPNGMVFLGDVAVEGYEPPNLAIVLRDTGDETLTKAPQEFQLVGHIRRQQGVDGISFWLPLAPPGYVALGCVAHKGTPKHEEFSSLKCIRSDMVIGDQFPDASIWDSSGVKVTEPFSLWSVDNEVGTFLVRSGFKKPPKRFALKLVGENISSNSDNTVIDAEVKNISAAVFDDYGALMVPLFNAALSNIGFNLHGRAAYMSSTVNFSMAARYYNDKYDSWEPLIEPMDGFLRYQYDAHAPGAATQLRMTSTRDINMNVSASDVNLMFQAYSSWNSFTDIHVSNKERETSSPTYSNRSIIDVHQRKSFYIIPQNRLGQDVYIRATETRGISKIIKMRSGDNSPIQVPVSKDLLDSHVKVELGRVSRSMVTIIIANAELALNGQLDNCLYMVAVRLFVSHRHNSLLQQLSARTSGIASEHSCTSGIALVKWNEAFYFKVDSLEDYMVEFAVVEIGKGEPIGIYSTPLKYIVSESCPVPGSYGSTYELKWRELKPPKKMENQSDSHVELPGRIRCTALLTGGSGFRNGKQTTRSGKSGYLQISPSREGPWTTVRLNYASPTTVWRLGNDVVASEVHVKDGNRYVNIRSLVSVTNNTDFVIDLHLKAKVASEILESGNESEFGNEHFDYNRIETDEYFETENYVPSVGWKHYPDVKPFPVPSDSAPAGNKNKGVSDIHLPEGWQWIDEWHVDKTSESTDEGWVYASDIEHLNWPKSSYSINSKNSARQRRWIRHRRCIAYKEQIPMELLMPGQTIPLPLSSLSHPVHSYILQLRPKNEDDANEYSWSTVVEKHNQSEVHKEQTDSQEVCLSDLMESNELLRCSQISGSSSSKYSQDLWFFLGIQAKEIGKDIHSDPIHDWNLLIQAPLSITNFLPIPSEYDVIDKQIEERKTVSKGNLHPGGTIKIYNVDPRGPLYLSILPQGGWQQIHEPVPIAHPSQMPAKTINLRNSFSGRIAQVILDQNYDKDQSMARDVRVYVPFWIASARCPPLTYNLVDISGRKEKCTFSIGFRSSQDTEKVLTQISEEELVDGCTILSTLNFKHLGLSASIAEHGKKHFGPIKDLSPLGDMDGSVDVYAYDTNGNCVHIFVSSKPCPYEAVPTKVISIRPFMTFTNRIGQDIFLRFNNSDHPKVLHASDARVSFVYFQTEEPDKLQIRLEDTDWCIPVGIVKEDIITLVLKRYDGGRRFLKTEIRGYEEGSRFLIVFRFGSADGPIRIENRTKCRAISIRQSGFDNNAWINVDPLSTVKFSWDDPYGQRLLDLCTQREGDDYVNVNLEKPVSTYAHFKDQGVQLNVSEVGDILIVRITDDNITAQSEADEKPVSVLLRDGPKPSQHEIRSSSAPSEFIIELGVVGISLIDHRPRELLYLYLEKLFISYSTGYDAGTTSRFKLIVGQLQLDNQHPFTVMPVLLAPEDMPDMNHPVLKATITMNNETSDGTEVYPYVYVRVTDKCWRLNIHEPIIWALLDFYNNLSIRSLPSSSSITQVDPEIRIDLIDVSEIRLKISLETAPAQRPRGVLGIWSPILSTIGNAFKLQVRLRKVMHKSRFMRKSAIIPAITNRIRRDLIHNPLHLISSVNILGMTKSTLASLSRGFAELSTDGQFLQLRSKQVWSRRITGVSDGILQGTEAFAQGVAFGVSGVVTKPVDSARQHGLIGFAHGIGRAFLGFVVQPLSGALDFVSLTVDGVGASFTRCVEILNNKVAAQRIRNPRAIHANSVLKEYSEKEATGQMVLYLAEASRHLGCTDLFNEPSKYAWSDHYEDHFIVPYQRIVLVTNKRVMLLQCTALEKMEKKPSKIIWDVPWDELLALELAKAGHTIPSHVIIHLKYFQRSESFVRIIKCNTEQLEDEDPQAVRICSSIRKMWKEHQLDSKFITLKVPSSQRHVQFSWDEAEGRDSYNWSKPVIKPRGLSTGDSLTGERKFIKHIVNFQKIWSSDQVCRNRCTLFPKQVMDDGTICTIWRPLCPDGYISVGDIAHVGTHPPNVAATYRNSDGVFALAIGYDLVWRNCADDYAYPVSIWLPRPPDGFVAVGCVAMADYEEPPPNSIYCVRADMVEDAHFEEQMLWAEPNAYPWVCYMYQVQSEALQFIALRQLKEQSNWKPMRVLDHQHHPGSGDSKDDGDQNK